MPSAIVFCDFDGTLTLHETLRLVLLHFLPERTPLVLGALGRGEITLRRAITDLVSHLPSAAVPEIRRLIAEQPLRPGIAEFLEYLASRRVPFVVVSSGLKFYIEDKLAPFGALIHGIHALEVDRDGPCLRPLPSSDHPREAVPKAEILLSYTVEPGGLRIAIGDSLSDYEMVEVADRVCARSLLLRELRARGRPVAAFSDFYDVRRTLEQEWGI